jgi:hypothetical protein
MDGRMKRVIDKPHVQSDVDLRYVQCTTIAAALIAVVALGLGTVAVVATADINDLTKVVDSIGQE